MAKAHQHKCTTCGDRYDCPGHFERNYDGFPEVICSAVHVEGVTECGDCWRRMACQACGTKQAPVSELTRLCDDCDPTVWGDPVPGPGRAAELDALVESQLHGASPSKLVH